MKIVPGGNFAPGLTWMRPFGWFKVAGEMQVQTPPPSRTKCWMNSCMLPMQQTPYQLAWTLSSFLPASLQADERPQVGGDLGGVTSFVHRRDRTLAKPNRSLTRRNAFFLEQLTHISNRI